ncbi:hypothetical protein [Flavobacterium sp. KACC 22761]|uniref:hypothetical protein n=1 Tax=Flavobacterium sp. KACC 22761 TaxID=3092665 RepID=UPI002A75ACF9|nr:hypothetical protein [Flavobacterium sp. KACC 22761]WPO78389.1 hypothetical protein SCB73_19200 [Flavobacterium sp. KACC 22761]
MEKYRNSDYNQHDPDFIEQNIIVNGSFNEDEFKQDLKEHNNREFGESDPDYIDQNTLVDNDNYARDEDPYQYQEEFIGDPQHPATDFESNTNIRSENIPNQERIVNEDDAITNDDRKNDFDEDYDPDLDLEKDDDLDDDNTKDIDDFEAEHFPENHPRE